MYPRLLCAFLISLSPARASENVPADKPTNPKVLSVYQKVLAEAQANPPAPGDIICLGSSHMQLWKTVKADLAPLTVHNFGIGGSRMSEAADQFIDHLAIPFRPRAVLLYEGSNDLGAGATPEAVLSDFQRLHRKLHAALPNTRLYVLGIVPSPGKRFERIADIRRTNGLLADECASHAWMRFLDTTSPLLGPDGLPRPECFIPNNLHMLPAGYEVWRAVLAPVIVPAETPYEKAPGSSRFSTDTPENRSSRGGAEAR